MISAERIAAIIEAHQPDMDKSCWANERWCKGCNDEFRVWPWSDFPMHQANLIVAECRARCRRSWWKKIFR